MSRRTRRTRIAEVNSQSPIDRFPPEVLLEIFTSLKDQHLEEFSGRKRLQWIAVTRVSRSWRTIALGCGRLWSNIQNGDPAIEEWLKRAQNSALFVELKIGTTRDEATFNMVLQKLSQIETLTIEISATIRSRTYSSVLQKLLALLSPPAPNLRSFKWVDMGPEVRSPVQFFSNTAPQLRCLQLEKTCLDHSSSLLDNLSTLTVYDSFNLLHPSEVLAMLARLSRLESLNLRNILKPLVISHAQFHLPANLPRVHLAKLKDFSYCGSDFNQDTAFIAHICCAVGARVFFASGLMAFGRDLSAFSRVIQVHNGLRDQSKPVQVLELNYRKEKFILVTSNQTFKPAQQYSAFSISNLYADEDFPDTWGVQLAQLPISELEYFRTNCEIGDRAWEALSRDCKQLFAICAVGPAAFEFIRCLLDDYDRNRYLWTRIIEDEAVDQTLPAFSDLQVIQLSDADFTGGGLSLVGALTVVLRERLSRSGFCVVELRVQHCVGFTQTMLENLRQAVTVRLDGELFLRYEPERKESGQ